ncbi:caspase family protein [Aquimarina gracilis]|uniref:Caspase family protein n=1 Tax=Aquimarina gracilis TaxID=874422 RepID=A0ABU5ZX05_9FLAO|nr:caspase family protein [Aquimarina gracilis]MEB3346396.1 caspase family protein [Aquimarina gracilis]
MNLHAVLIGINEYELNPLQQCVNDVGKIENYLNSLKDSFQTISIKKLIDKDATKANIVESITGFLTNANDDDVAFMYYSGHGALEEASGRFSDAHSGTIESLVCYNKNKENQEIPFLLADKELRYAFSTFINDPHLITVFDCCHSGDIVRSVAAPHEDARKRKLSTIFPSRTYDQFIFSDKISEEDIKTKKLASLIPFKNSLNVSACLSSESSWEDSKGGVFTRYLLQLLSAKNNNISYVDIVKWAKISLRDITNKKQTPTISVQGQGKIDHYCSWLNINPKHTQTDKGYIYFNNKNGWYYDKGKLFGIKEGSEIEIRVDQSKTITTKITKAYLENALIEDPFEMGVSLDPKKSYPVATATIYAPLLIYIQNLDNDSLASEQIKTIINNTQGVTLCKPETASYFITIFNQTAYITLPNESYKPLAVQIDLLENSEADIGKRLSNQLNFLIKWNHYHTLSNPEENFSQTAIKVEIRVGHDQSWQDITNSDFDLVPIENQLTRNDEYFQKYQVKVSNVSNEEVYVTALLLSSDLAIITDPFDHKTKHLKPGESIMFYEHTSTPYAGWSLDSYKEIYNWKHDYLHYKFIINNTEDITATIPEMAQTALPAPITHYGNMMGHGAISDFLPHATKWGVYTSSLRLANPNYNIISNKIIDNWEWYSSNEMVAPFINCLYSKQEQNGFLSEYNVNLPNATEDLEINSKGLMDLVVKFGNHLDDKRRYRRFKKSKKLFPGLPVIVAEGDSWFLFPFLVKDTLDYVMEKYPLRSLAAAGDEIQNYRKSGQLLKEIKKVRPKYVLISGGGNDIIGPEIVNILKEGMPPGLEPAKYLNEAYVQKTKDIESTYNYFFNRIYEFDFVEQVFVHGYDYVRADHNSETIKNGWVNRYLIQKGITNLEDRTKVLTYLIDEFNELLSNLTARHKNATYLNMRSLVEKTEWHDEIHPNDEGFAKVAGRFIEAINQLEYIT